MVTYQNVSWIYQFAWITSCLHLGHPFRINFTFSSLHSLFHGLLLSTVLACLTCHSNVDITWRTLFEGGPCHPVKWWIQMFTFYCTTSNSHIVLQFVNKYNFAGIIRSDTVQSPSTTHRYQQLSHHRWRYYFDNYGSLIFI